MSSTRSWINSIFSAIEPTIFQNSVFGHLIYAKKKLKIAKEEIIIRSPEKMGDGIQ
jgi:hypothetical protein